MFLPGIEHLHFHPTWTASKGYWDGTTIRHCINHNDIKNSSLFLLLHKFDELTSVRWIPICPWMLFCCFAFSAVYLCFQSLFGDVARLAVHPNSMFWLKGNLTNSYKNDHKNHAKSSSKHPGITVSAKLLTWKTIARKETKKQPTESTFSDGTGISRWKRGEWLRRIHPAGLPPDDRPLA